MDDIESWQFAFKFKIIGSKQTANKPGQETTNIGETALEESKRFYLLLSLFSIYYSSAYNYWNIEKKISVLSHLK